VERGEEEVARAVAGEEAAGTVRAVGGGGEAEKYDARLRISETGDRTAPVALVRKGGPFFVGDFFAPLDQAWAASAGGYLLLQGGELFLFRRRSGSV
jgi:hypothetical protein